MTGAKLLRAGQRIYYPDQDEAQIVEAEHRDHAVVEQVIADLKDQALAHFPSEHFYANSAWTLHLPARWPWHGEYVNALNPDPRAPAA